MDWLNNLAQNSETPLLAAFALGLLTAIAPCPLATNITATAFIAKTITDKRKVLLSGFLYTLGRVFSYTLIGAIIYFGVSKFQIAKLFQGNGEKYIGFVLIVIGLIMLDVIKLNFIKGGNLTDKLSERFKTQGLLGSFFVGRAICTRILSVQRRFVFCYAYPHDAFYQRRIGTSHCIFLWHRAARHSLCFCHCFQHGKIRDVLQSSH